MPHVEGVRHEFLTTRNARIHIAMAGHGPAVVLLHGWPQHWWAWRRLIGPRSSRMTVVCPDLRGFGWSSGADGSYRWDDLAADVLAVVDALGFDRVELVGHDWGVAIGYRACLLWPDRFERFTALGL